MRVKFTDGFLGDAGQGTAPTGVNGGDGAFFGIDQKNGNAVGGLNSEENTGRFCEGGVGFAGFLWSRGEGPDDGGMNLFERDEREFWGAEGSLEFFAIFADVFTGVPVGETKVKNLLAVEFGDATRARAESVDEPRKLFEGVEFEDFQIARRAERPGFFDFRCAGGGWKRFAGFAARHGRISSDRHLISIIGSEIV